MLRPGTRVLGRCVVPAAIVALAALGPAHAEVPTATRAFTPAALPASAPAAPAPIPAVIAPGGRIVVPQHAKAPAIHSGIAPIPQSAAACTAVPQTARLDHPLLHTARRLAGDRPLTIVALGSSSTAGAGASSPASSYPSRLAAELKILFPGHDIRVINRGVNGEEIPNMMARFQSGVFAEHPQLVLWQLGTNSVLREHPLQPHLTELRSGIEQLKSAGFDVVLIDPQYAPKVLAKSETPGMVEQIALAAKEENVDLFHRFAIMHNWYERQHYSFGVFVSPDGLHMNDWGYACWAKLLAASIAAAANPPIASAVQHPQH
jgi:acyl-CoA thioesterase I